MLEGIPTGQKAPAQKASFSILDRRNITENNQTFSLSSNIIDGDLVRSQISATLSYLSDHLSRTLGPYGTNTIVCNSSELKHFLSKDGYAVLKEITLVEPLPRTILDLIKRISFRLVRTVGDGSTTAVVASNEIFQAINEEYTSMTSLVPPKDFIDIMEKIVREIITKIYESARKVENIDNLEKIAFISTNNDRKTAKFIRDVFESLNGGESDVSALATDIEIESNLRSTEDSVDLDSGYKINRSFVDPIFATKTTDTSIVYEVNKGIIFACDGTLTSMDQKFVEIAFKLYSEKYYNERSGLIFVAKGFDQEIISQFKAIKDKFPHVPVMAVDIATTSFDSMQRFTDLCVYTDCKPYLKESGVIVNMDEVDEDMVSEMFGSCGRVVSNDSKTIFYKGDGDHVEIQKRISEIEEGIESNQETEDALERDSRVNALRLRLNMLSGRSAVIRVGGRTSQEVENRKFLIEDAVFACQSAIKFGVVCGGSLIVPKIIHRNRNEIIENLDLGYDSEKEVASIILELISNSFTNIFKRVIQHVESDVNRDRIGVNSDFDATQEDLADAIANYCVRSNSMFDAKRFVFEDENDTQVINSSETDIEVLRGTSSIVSLIASSDQFVSGR